MPITITGDMTQDEVDNAMLKNFRELIDSSAGAPIQITHRQAVHLLGMIKDKSKDKPGG
jgi:hypothetical protein